MLMNSFEKQILFLQEELRNKNKFISSLMDQLLKNSDTISSCQQEQQHTYTRHNNILREEETENTSVTQNQ